MQQLHDAVDQAYRRADAGETLRPLLTAPVAAYESSPFGELVRETHRCFPDVSRERYMTLVCAECLELAYFVVTAYARTPFFRDDYYLALDALSAGAGGTGGAPAALKPFVPDDARDRLFEGLFADAYFRDACTDAIAFGTEPSTQNCVRVLDSCAGCYIDLHGSRQEFFTLLESCLVKLYRLRIT